MKLTGKLLGYLHSAFDRSAHGFIAFRVRHTSTLFRWVVSERVFYGYDGEALLFQIDLSQYTIEQLCGVLLTKPGISVPFTASRSELKISACALIDGSGAQAASNGDCVSAYTSVIWMYMDALATELSTAKQRLLAMLDQMNIKDADEEWLDEWGAYFGVVREIGEADADYSNRIIVEVMQPRGNNKAMEAALFRQFGQVFVVNDIVRYKDALTTYDGTFDHDGEKSPGVPFLYDATSDPVYGLFYVDAEYNLESGLDMLAYAAAVRAFIEKLRDAGTHLDSLRLTGSSLADVFTAPSDSAPSFSITFVGEDVLTAPTESQQIAATLSPLTENLSAPADSGTLTESYATLYNGLRTFDGTRLYRSGSDEVAPL